MVAFLWVAVALIILPMATRMVIDNATAFADYSGVGELVMGAPLIANALKGQDDIAIGNLIGASIYNIAIVLGSAGADKSRRRGRARLCAINW